MDQLFRLICFPHSRKKECLFVPRILQTLRCNSFFLLSTPTYTQIDINVFGILSTDRVFFVELKMLILMSPL